MSTNQPDWLRGCGTALITPFAKDRSIDEPALRRLVRFQIEEGIDFLVPGGTTGETPALSTEEHVRVVAITVEESRRAARRVPVLAGAGGNNTEQVVIRARQMAEAGADGILSVSPYYNKPNPAGLVAHYSAIAGTVKLPLVVYNVPGRTGSNIAPATLAQLARIPGVVGVKEASGNIPQMGEILAELPGFLVLSGDDALTLPLLALGGHGLISVAANEIPRAMTDLVRCGLAGDFAAARALHFRYLTLMQVNFIESNPIPVKAALARMGLCQEVYRLPLAPLADSSRRQLEAALEQVGLLPASVRAV